jgi:Spy/CpxP family protein refolding chaperone
MSEARKTTVLLLSVFFAALLGCGAGCMIAIHLFGHDEALHGGSHSDAHHWLHGQLGLTEAQLVELGPIEERFAAQEASLKAALAEANVKVGALLIEDRVVSPRVQAAVDEVHRAMAAHQKATLDHLVEMQTVLTPDQYTKLLELAGDALGH